MDDDDNDRLYRSLRWIRRCDRSIDCLSSTIDCPVDSGTAFTGGGTGRTIDRSIVSIRRYDRSIHCLSSTIDCPVNCGTDSTGGGNGRTMDRSIRRYNTIDRCTSTTIHCPVDCGTDSTGGGNGWTTTVVIAIFNMHLTVLLSFLLNRSKVRVAVNRDSNCVSDCPPNSTVDRSTVDFIAIRTAFWIVPVVPSSDRPVAVVGLSFRQ